MKKVTHTKPNPPQKTQPHHANKQTTINVMYWNIGPKLNIHQLAYINHLTPPSIIILADHGTKNPPPLPNYKLATHTKHLLIYTKQNI